MKICTYIIVPCDKLLRPVLFSIDLFFSHTNIQTSVSPPSMPPNTPYTYAFHQAHCSSIFINMLFHTHTNPS